MSRVTSVVDEWPRQRAPCRRPLRSQGKCSCAFHRPNKPLSSLTLANDQDKSLTTMVFGNPGSNGSTLSSSLICWVLQRNRQRLDVLMQMLDLAPSGNGENVWRLLHDILYAIAIAATAISPSFFPCALAISLATFSSVRDIFFSSSDRSQFRSRITRPFSPVCRRLSSSASERSLPAPITFQGASARPT